MNENLPDGFFSLDNSTFLGIMLRFGIDIFFLFILISLVYFRYSKKEKLLFTMYLMGIMVFFICSMLGTVHLDISFALSFLRSRYTSCPSALNVRARFLLPISTPTEKLSLPCAAWLEKIVPGFLS